jgi:very-short-patch-repair endonuclease
MKIYYNQNLKKLSQELRRNATYSERLLWRHLKGRQMHCYQFTRQKPVENYIVDFYCSKLHLVIEIDGITHGGKQKYDEKRDNRLRQIGLTVLRFNTLYVVNQIHDTLMVISEKIRELENTTP